MHLPILRSITIFPTRIQISFCRRQKAIIKPYSFVNQQLPMDAKVLLQGIVKGYYCQRETYGITLINGYCSIVNLNILERC